MTKGIIVGKFLPPHLGHQYLIEQGLKQCDSLTVFICDRPEYIIPARLRKIWLEEIVPGPNYLIVKDTLDDNDSEGWAKNTIKLLGHKPDIAFTSEDYGIKWAKFMGAKHVIIDRERSNFPISATQIRANPWLNWQYLSPTVRAYFCKRICLVGSESTGTTTLSEALAKVYKTKWVPEYGRTYSELQQTRLEKEGWKTKDFIKIAKEQNRQEDLAASQADKVLFCDTDSFATSIWHERYMGTSSHEVEKLAVGRRYDLYFLTDVNIPFVQDGLRDGEHLREWMHAKFQDRLRFWDKPYVITTGSPEQRLEQASAIVDMLLSDKNTRIEGLTRNSWHSSGGL